MATTVTNSTRMVAAKRKSVFKKVDQLKHGTSSHTLMVKVVSSKKVKVGNEPSGRSLAMLMARPLQPTRIAECLVGDERLWPSYLWLITSKVTTSLVLDFFGCEMENGYRGK